MSRVPSLPILPLVCGALLWRSTDAARVPVKMSGQHEVGAFVLTLSSRT